MVSKEVAIDIDLGYLDLQELVEKEFNINHPMVFYKGSNHNNILRLCREPLKTNADILK